MAIEQGVEIDRQRLGLEARLIKWESCPSNT
jgi:hypothetical protein